MREGVTEGERDRVEGVLGAGDRVEGELVEIDGSRGEGGGQVLRTSLALSMITRRPLRIRQIRAGRSKPGLRRQHLACVQAAARLCGAVVHGDRLGSQWLEFVPAATHCGDLEIDIGTAGSTTLVIQTVLVPAIVLGQPLRVVVTGGTHNPMAPPFDFLDRVFLPHLRAMGADVALRLDRHGFASEPPARGEAPTRHGQLTLEVGRGRLAPIEIVGAGPITARHATALLARLPTHVADRELRVIRERLGFSAAECEVREVRDAGPGNLVMLEVERAEGRELVTQFGERGLRAERVAERACDELEAFLASGAPVGEHLADQLLLPLAIASGGKFRAAPLASHAVTNIETIGQFLDLPIDVATEPDGRSVTVSLGPR
ncbi:MAG: RNA 3'-terminal phosphate cyclase [Kofleriaceae bacterium]